MGRVEGVGKSRKEWESMGKSRMSGKEWERVEKGRKE